MTKEILLIQPSYPTSPFPGAHLPVGLGYLAEQLIKAGINYEVIDMNFYNFSFLEDKIISFAPDYIGISLMSLDIEHNYKLISKIKKCFPLIKTIAGGPHISFVKEEALSDCPEIDIGITYEGEESLIELIQLDSPLGIKGVLWRSGEEIIYNSNREFIQNLEIYQFPTYKKFGLNKYEKRIDIISSRGCPFGCTFCGAHLSMGKKWRGRSADAIVEEMEFWYEQGYRDFKFVDSNFFFNKERVIEFCDKLKMRGLEGITMSSDGMRAEDADFEMLKKMKEFGFNSVAIGVESVNDEVLKNIKKGEIFSEIEKRIKICIDLDLNVVLFFIIGLPGETKESIEDSFKFALKYPVADAYFFNVNPLPKTELYEWAEKNGYLLTSKENMFNNIGGMGEKPLMITPELSYDDRRKLYKKGLLISKKVKRKFNEYQQEKRARQIHTHLTDKEKMLLKRLAGKVPKDGVILEVGSYLGASACFLALGAKKRGQRIYCVDTWQNDAMSEGKRDTFAKFLKNIESFNDKIVPLRGVSEDIAKTFDKKIHLLFIDADHSYEGCSFDIKNWFPHLNKNSIVIFHDYGWANGVRQAVAEYVEPIKKRPAQVFENMYWTKV